MDNIFDINEETKLYKVIENDNGDLVYCDINGNSIDTNGVGWQNKLVEICKVGDVKFEESDSLDIIFNKNNKSGIGATSNIDGNFNFYVCSDNIKTHNESVSNSESIIISTGGSLSLHYIDNFIAKKGYSYSNDVFVLTNKDKEIDLKYSYYYLSSITEYINKISFKNSKYTGIGHFTNEHLKMISIKLPQPYTNKDTQPYKEFSSLDIQKSLSFLIEQSFQDIEDKIDKLNTLEVILDKNKESFLDEVFMDMKDEDGNKIKFEEKKLIELNKITNFLNKQVFVDDTKNKFLLETGFYTGNKGNLLKNNDYIVYENNEKEKKKGYILPKYTILQSSVRPYLKNFTMIKNDIEDEIVVSTAFNYFYNENVNINKILFLVMNSGKYKNFILNNQDESGQKPSISQTIWENFSFFLPNDEILNDQNKFNKIFYNIETYLSEIERKKDNIEKMIMILNKQKDNVLNTIFSF